MKRHTLLIALLMLITLTEASISRSQWTVQDRSADKDFIAEQITLKTPTATLYGHASPSTITLKNASCRLIIAGSGPTDRDGNSPVFKGHNDSLKLLAEGLAAHVIASLRYDKRGIGETGKAMQLAAEKAKTPLREEDISSAEKDRRDS